MPNNQNTGITVEPHAGKRIQLIRGLMGITREDFAETFELDLTRLKNMEQGRCRVSDLEFERIGRRLPELLPWMAFGGTLVLEQMKKNTDAYMVLIVARIQSGAIKKTVMEQFKNKIK